jgi:hypothetical protein
MRARGWSALALLSLMVSSAAAEPKPKPVDIKAVRDKLVVLQDAEGGTYVAFPGGSGEDGRVFYGAKGKTKNVYEQVVIGRSSDGSTGAWDLSVWAPRVPNVQPGSVGRHGDGTFFRYCGGDNTSALTELTGDKAKAVLDKSAFFSSALIRRPHLLARDDGGVYYYVDVIRNEYGGKGFRVFIGKKGAMKQKPLTDIASDTAGDVFATKTGDLRIVNDTDANSSTVTWVKGEKRVTLRKLDTDANSPLIFKDLGVYSFTGTICENI